MLNMGHTVGHAVEKLKNFTMAHGPVCGSRLYGFCLYFQKKRADLSGRISREVAGQLQSFGLPLYVDGLSTESVLEATKSDKKMEKGADQVCPYGKARMGSGRYIGDRSGTL